MKGDRLAGRRGYAAGTTYGKAVSRIRWATDGFNPDGTAMLVTSESMASGALSAIVRPLRAAKPKTAGVPTTYESRSG